MKLAYKLFFILNTLFTLYIFANNFILYETSPDNIFIFVLIALLLIAITVYYFIKDIKPNKFDYIFSSIYILFLLASMIVIISIQNSFTYANTICYFDTLLYIPCILYIIYGLTRNKD
jgi:thiol:disulfide interchange protein